jgi:uncharacterized protein YcgL (UPF0745 family)
MICYVYRSNRKRDTYLYIKQKDDFSQIPETVLTIFGPPEYSLSFDLHAEKKLAQADALEVINQLENTGFYLQLPKSDYDIMKIEQELVASLKKN